MTAKGIVIGLVLSALVCAAARAEEPPAENDPFHPAEKTVTAPAPSPGYSEWERDPFVSPFARTAPAQKDQAARAGAGMLTGIIYAKQRRVAIIGGEVLREGSMVGDKRLVDIRRRSIVLMNAAGAFEEVFLQDFSIGR